MPQESCTIAKTIPDFTFAFIEAVPLLLVNFRWKEAPSRSNKK